MPRIRDGYGASLLFVPVYYPQQSAAKAALPVQPKAMYTILPVANMCLSCLKNLSCGCLPYHDSIYMRFFYYIKWNSNSWILVEILLSNENHVEAFISANPG